MKPISSIIRHFTYCLALLAPLALAACSSNDDDDDPTSPTSPISPIEPGTDQRPNWQTPDFDTYELTMSVEVRLQDTLQAYASAQDLLCATIGSEVSGLAQPMQVDGVWLFPLTVGSNNSSADVTLSYYCDRLHRIFTVPWTTFDPTTAPMGEGGIYAPTFVK